MAEATAVHIIRRLPSSIVLALVACLLVGCIVVDDFAEYWNKGFVDTCVNEIVLRDMEEDDNGSPSAVEMRSLKLGDHTFLMMRDHPSDKGGNLMLYKLDKEDFITYRLDENKREDFLRDYPDAGIILTSETATIPVLNQKTADLLQTIASDANYWHENERHPYNPTQRTDCIHELPK